mmetsp:Transcript_32503/g.103638  ORF Transcript_32503/g.103638 Transcript_32503/m.103638 type:complete len:385 (-) Transcript_32503:595-1749(-)
MLEVELGVDFDEAPTCAAGLGATLRVEVRGPSTAVAGARAVALGRYVARLRVGNGGAFDARAVVDVDRCQATTRCDPLETRLLLRSFAARTTTTRTTTITVSANNETSTSTSAAAATAAAEGYWTRLSPQQQRRPLIQWRPEPAYREALLRGKWIHFVGMSTSRMMLYDVIRVLKKAGHDPVGWRPELKRCDKGEHPDVRFPSLQSLRLTLLCHDLGMQKERSGRWRMNATKHFASVRQLNGPPRPDVVVVNKGIHVAEYATTTRILDEYRDNIRQHLTALGGDGTLVVWRRSLPTHFRHEKPHPAWNCRLWERLDCLNAVADDAIPLGVQVLDYWDLALARPDCTRDNRHYTHGNCGEVMAKLFLQLLDEKLPETSYQYINSD